jgi:ABC-type antimicrobial peptide transport system permease subunit
MILVRLHPGVSAAAGRASLEHIADRSNRIFDAFGPASACAGQNVTVVSAEQPAAIVNYRSMGDTPALLAAGLAVGAVAALGLTLTASVRRRRRDLAVFKTLGFVRGQLMAAVAWQSTVAVGIGTVIGVPLGIISGRILWNLFARAIYVVPAPTVPAPVIGLIVVGSLVLANVVAAVPGRLAARTPTALLLRAE